jgi:palmitoyltransferase
LKSYINKTDIFGNTAILYAAYRGNILIIRSLIECGADVNVTSKNGLNVLHMAAQGNNPNIIIYFKIKYNISVLSTDLQGNTPLHWASYNSSEEAINFLLSYMTDINIKNNDGKTPLHIAVFTEKPSLIKKLIKRGADINIKDKNGKTPYDLALELTGAESRVTGILMGIKKQKNLVEKLLNISCINSDNNNNFASIKNQENNGLSKIYLVSYIILIILELFLQLDFLPNIYVIIFFIACFILFISFIYMSFNNPGIIEDSNYKNIDWLELVFNDVPIKNMCPYCKVRRQKLSKHCFFCNKCIKEQNYHCNIVNNCIGENNYGGYIFFLLMHLIIFFYMGMTSFKIFFIQDLINIQYIIQINFLHNIMVKNITAMIIMIFSGLGFIIVFVITFRHIRQLIINYKIKEFVEN